MVGIERNAVLEPLAPLVMAGYKSFAARVLNGVNSWYSSISPSYRKELNALLSSVIPPSQKSVPVLYLPTPDGKGKPRVMSESGSLLEDSISSAAGELSALAETGDVSGVNPATFDRLLFVFGCSYFGKNVIDEERSILLAYNIATSYYSAAGNVEFVRQLDSLFRLGGIRMASSPSSVEHTDDGRISVLTFNTSRDNPVVPTLISSLRLLYRAANPPVNGLDDATLAGLSQLGERLIAAYGGKGIASEIPCAYLRDVSNVRTISYLLGQVRLHRGVEDMIFNSPVLAKPDNLVFFREVLRLGNALDTIQTGKVALLDNDKPYSDAIGIAELMAE